MSNLVECCSIIKNYNNIRVLNRLNLCIPDKGSIIGLLGKNGSGKTTLLQLLSGISTPTEGDILFVGKKMDKKTKSLIAYYSKSARVNDNLTIGQVVGYYKDFFDDFNAEKAWSLLKQAGISISQKTDTLTDLQYQILGIILTFSREAKMYLLDEPILNTDVFSKEYILQEIIKKKPTDATVIIATNSIGDIESVADYIVCLQEGQVVCSGEVENLLTADNRTIGDLFKGVYK